MLVSGLEDYAAKWYLIAMLALKHCYESLMVPYVRTTAKRSSFVELYTCGICSGLLCRCSRYFSMAYEETCNPPDNVAEDNT